MAKKLYCYEGGSCRGDEFTNKVVFDDIDKLIAMMEEGIALNLADEDEYDTFIDGLFGTDDSYEMSNAKVALINGGDCCDQDHTAAERIQLIKDGKSFNIILEESELGFGPTKKEAKLAFVEIPKNGDDW